MNIFLYLLFLVLILASLTDAYTIRPRSYILLGPVCQANTLCNIALSVESTTPYGDFSLHLLNCNLDPHIISPFARGLKYVGIFSEEEKEYNRCLCIINRSNMSSLDITYSIDVVTPSKISYVIPIILVILINIAGIIIIAFLHRNNRLKDIDLPITM